MYRFDEIGSEFWKTDVGGDIKNTIEKAVFTASGRSAQSLIIAGAGIENKTALLPAYTCQHIVEPFAWNGWEVDYYDIHKDLTIDLESLKEKIKKHPGCIIVQSYYGFHTTDQAEPLFGEAQKAGSVIMEDITHSFLSGWNPGFKQADYLFCSLRKWSGLTDGGYAVALKGKRLSIPHKEMKRFAQDRADAQILKRRYIETGDLQDKEKFLALFTKAENSLDGDIGIYAMSKRAKSDFFHIDFEQIRKKRQQNYLYLLKNMKSDYVHPIFSRLPDDTCPIMFPVYVEKARAVLHQKLIDHRIYCPVHWPAPVQLTPEAKEGSDPIYNQIMSIPCDQRYTTEDMGRITDVINIFSLKG